jgi:hypothetical protein
MELMQSIMVPRIIVILGIINILTGAAIYFSCRCLPGARLMGRMMKYNAFQRFYKYHCYIWRVFWPSVLIHSLLALMFFGLPF